MTRAYDASTTASEFVKDLYSEITGKTILTTGVSPGNLGSAFVEAIAAAKPNLLVLAGRNISKFGQTATAVSEAHPLVNFRLLELDLCSLASVRKSAEIVNSWVDVDCIDVLVNNAGIMATPYKLSPEGFESQFATNHLGHFLFTNLIMDKILTAKAPRVVMVSSDGHRLNPIRWGHYNFGDGKTYNKWHAYGQSKTANMLFAVSLAQKLGQRKGLLAFSLHPGVIMDTTLGAHVDWDTDLASLRAVDQSLGNTEGWADFKIKTMDQGIATHVYAAFESSLEEHNGAYLQDSHIANPWTETVKPWATSVIEAERLWDLSEKLVGQQFSY